MKGISAFANCIVAILLSSLAVQAQQSAKATSASGQAAATPGTVFPGTVTGTGTANYIPEWTGASTLGNSVLYQTGGKIGVGTTSPIVALDVAGRVNVSKSFQIAGFDIVSIPGGLTAQNTTLGYEALDSGGSGYANTAVGSEALSANTTGSNNTAIGVIALFSNTAGSQNIAVGIGASQYSSTGSYNTALGMESLRINDIGSNNIGIGYQGGYNVTGNNNVDIANEGTSSDNGIVRIGTSGTQTSLFAAGIRGVTTGLSNAVPVMIDSNGQLGTVSSSRRFKEDIQEMGDTSLGLLSLRPVTFRYKKAFADGSKPTQYGLIAEEVAEVYPDLVARSADGQIETVKYQVLDSMLLNEVQRQQREIQALQERLAKMEAALAPAGQAK